MHTKLSAAGAVLAFFLVFESCQKDEPTKTLDQSLDAALTAAAKNGAGPDFFAMPESWQYAKIPQDPKNPISTAKVELGKLLFHETALANNPRVAASLRTYSCASCHHADGGFQACLSQGVGEGGLGFGRHGEGRLFNALYPEDSLDVQPVRTPSALNIAFQTNILWNGQFGATFANLGTEAEWTPGTPKEVNKLGFEGAETQAIAGQKVHRLKVDANYLASLPVYKTYFDVAFSDLPEAERITNVTVGLAIAAYERTLLANQSPFQLWLKGQREVMSEDEKRGAVLFFDKAGCVECHTGPALNSMEFYGLGMNNLDRGSYGAVAAVDKNASDAGHKGRGGFTGRAEDMHKFKVPQLYNLADSPFYGHGSSFNEIEAVVRYKNEGKKQNPDVPDSQLASQFKPLGLTDDEVRQIALFIEKSLRDPQLSRYSPSYLPSGLCFPNNDPQAKIDTGCH